MRVVVVDVVDHEPLELALVPDDGAVKELSSQGAHPAFGERVGHWDADRGAQDLETFGSEDLVEVAGELAGAVTNEGSGVGEPLWVAQQQVSRGLGGPGCGGVGGDAAVEDFAVGDVDEEQQVVVAQQGRVDGHEVAGNGGLGAQELGPGQARALRSGVDAVLFEDSPHSGGPNAVTEADELAGDAAVAPRGAAGSLWVPIIRSWALTRGFALHPGTRNRYEIRYTRTQHRPASRQVNDHGRVAAAGSASWCRPDQKPVRPGGVTHRSVVAAGPFPVRRTRH